MEHTDKTVIVGHDIKHGWHILEGINVDLHKTVKHYFAYHVLYGSLESANLEVIEEYINITRKCNYNASRN